MIITNSPFPLNDQRQMVNGKFLAPTTNYQLLTTKGGSALSRTAYFHQSLKMIIANSLGCMTQFLSEHWTESYTTYGERHAQIKIALGAKSLSRSSGLEPLAVKGGESL